VRGRAVADLAVLDALDGDLTRAMRLAAESDEIAAEIGGTDAALLPAAATATGWAHLQRYALARSADWSARARRRDGAGTDATAPVLAVLGSRTARLRHEYDDAEAHLAPWLGEAPVPGWARAHVLGEAVLLEAARGGPAEALLDGVEDAPWRRRLGARLALTRGEPAPAEGTDAEPGAGLAVHVEALLLRASRLLVAGREGAATDVLVEALETARPEVLRLPFLDAPPQARRALRVLPRLRDAAAWLNPAAPLPTRRPGAPRSADAPPAVVEALSGRETEVLRHLAELLSTEEIAATMFVSVNTVRTHIRSILRKLGVTRRNDAVRRAKELGLLR
jgi:LuxR family maltose regulon positive regulatory protein